VTEQQGFYKALGAWQCEMPAKQSGTMFRLAHKRRTKQFSVQSWFEVEDFYMALDECPDAILWLGAQLRV